MANVEENIVQMRFDNAQFEKGVQQSVKSIDNLKKSLNFKGISNSLSSIEKAASRFNLSGITSSLESVKSRFTTLGVAGASVINNLTTTAMNAGSKIFSAISTPLVEGGKRRALNIEQAKFQFKGLGMSVEKSMKSALDAVSGTAYGLDEAAKAASQFGASGMKAGAEMTKSLRAIAGVSAMTNSEYSDIARIFTQVSGQGKLMGDQLLQLSGRGINAASTLAKYMKKSEAEVREMVSKGQIDFKTFYTAMDEAFGEHAKDANKTFTGAMSNVKAALSRIGADVATPAYANLRKVFVSLISVIDEMHEAFTPMIELMEKGIVSSRKFAVTTLKAFNAQAFKANMSAIVSIVNSFFTLIGKISPVFDEIKEAWNSAFPSVSDQTLTNLAESFANLVDELVITENVLNGVSGSFSNIFQGFAGAIQSIASYVIPIKDGLTSVFSGKIMGYAVTLTELFRDFWVNLKLSTENSNRLRNIVENLSEVFGMLINASFRILRVFVDLSNGSGAFVSNLLSGAENITNFIRGVASSAEVSTLFSKALNGISGALTLTGNLIGYIGTVIGTFTAAVSESFASMTKAFSDTFVGATSLADGIVQVVLHVIDIIPEAIGRAISAIGRAVSLILENLPIGEVNAAIQDTLFTLIMKNILDFSNGIKGPINSINEFFGSFKQIGENVSSMFENLGNAIGSFTASIKANVLLKIAVSLGILAVSLRLLADIPLEQLGASLGALAGGLIVMGAASAGLLAVLKKMAGDLKGTIQLIVLTSQLRKMALSMVLFAAAVKILAGAMQDLSGMSWDEIVRGLVSISAMSAIMIGITKLAEYSKGMAKTAVMLVLFSGCIRIMTGALMTMAQLSWDELSRGLFGLGASMLVMAGAMKVISSAAKSKGIVGSAAILLAFSVSLSIMGNALQKFSDVDFSSILKAAAGTIIILGVVKRFSEVFTLKQVAGAMLGVTLLGVYAEIIGHFAEGIAKFEGINFNTVVKATTTMTAILLAFSVFVKRIENPWAFSAVAGSLWAITNAIKSFGESVQFFADMPFKTLFKGMIAIAAGLAIMLTAMSKLSVASKETDEVKMSLSRMFGAAAFDMLVFGISMFADAVSKMGSLDVKTLAKGLVAISVGIAVMVSAMNSIKGGAGSGAAFVLMAFGISMMIGPIQVLGSMPLSELAKGLIGLAAALAIINVAATTMSKNVGNLLKMAGTLTVVGASIVVFGLGLTAMIYPIKQIGQLNEGQMATSILGLAGIMSTLYAFAMAMKNLPKFDAATLVKLAIMTVVIGAIGYVLTSLGSLDSHSALEAAAGLSSVLLSVSAALFVLSKVQVAGALKGVAAMAVIIGGISAIVAAMGAIAQIPGAKWLMEEGKQFMMSVGDAIGSFFGSIIGGVAGGAINGVGKALPEFGKSLSDFMTAATPFFNGVQTLAGGSLEGVKSFAEAIALISASNILTSVTSWITGGSSLEVFGEQLSAFAPYLLDFSMIASSINGPAIESAAKAAKALTNFANNLPKSGGLAGTIFGESDLLDFGRKIEEFGPILKNYGESVKGIDASAVRKSSEAAKGLAEFANALPRSGGLSDSILGSSTDVVSFGNGLLEFAPILVSYSKVAKKVDAKAISSSAKAGMALTELASTLPRTGGLVDYIMGFQMNLSEFGTQLAAFGSAIMMYSDSVKGIEPDSIVASAKAASSLVELAKELPRVGGLIEYFTGSQIDLTHFGTQIVAFGSAIMSFSDSVKGVEPDAISASANAAMSLSSLWKDLPRIGGVVDFFAGSQDFSKFSTGIVYLGNGIKSFAKSTGEIDPSKVSAAGNAAKVLAELSNALPKFGGLQQFIEGAPDLAKFGSGCTYLGVGIKNFAKNVDGIDSSSITNVSTAAKAIVELANAAPYTGGLQEFVSGTKDISGFKENMADLGEGIKSFAEATVDVDSEKIASVGSAADVIAKLSEAAPYTGGFNQFIEGTKDLGSLGTSLVGLGEGLNGFIGAISVEGFNAEVVNATSNLVGVLAEFAAAAPFIGGLKSFWEGVKNIEGFGTSLSTLGEAVVSYCEKVSVIDPSSIDTINASTEVMKALAEVSNVIDNSGGFAEIWTGTKDFSSMKDNCRHIGEAVKVYAANVAGTDFSKVSESVNAVTSIKDMFNNLKDFDSSGVEKFKETLEGTEDMGLTAFRDNVSGAVEGVTNVLNDFTNKIDEAANSVNSSYGVLQEALTKEMPNDNNFVVSTIKKINENIPKAEPGGKAIGEKFSNGVTNVIKSKYGEFFASGRYAMEGVAAGINSGAYVAVSAASNAAQSCLTAFNNKLKIQSPSREFMKSGMYADMGAAKGMKRYAYLVRNAGTNLGKSAHIGLEAGLSKLGSKFDMNIDDSPTIRPVIDLSAVKSGSREIDGLINSKEFAINASVSGKMSNNASSLNVARVAALEDSNTDLLKAIKGLGDTISQNTGGNVYLGSVQYSPGTEVSDAIGSLANALKLNGRS